MKNLIYFFLQNLNIRTRSKITESKHKITEPDPKCKNIRMGFIPVYRNIQKAKITDLNSNGYPNNHS